MWLLCGYCVATVWLMCGYCVATDWPRLAKPGQAQAWPGLAKPGQAWPGQAKLQQQQLFEDYWRSVCGDALAIVLPDLLGPSTRDIDTLADNPC